MKTFLLNRLYPKALDGLPVLGTPESIADEFRKGRGSKRERAERMIRRHIALAGTAGFVGGLPGWLLLPITLPANIAGVALVQLHMAASCAALAGRDLQRKATRDEVVECLLKTDSGTENSEEEEAANRVGVKLAERGLRFLIRESVQWGARTAGRRVLGRATRGIPLVGGAIGAASDTYSTRIVAKHTLDTFFPPAENTGLIGDGLPAATAEPTASQ